MKSLILRQFESDDHAKYWKDYEWLLIIRSMIAIASRIFLSIMTQMSGSSITKISDEFIEEKGPVNLDLAIEL